MSDYETLIMRSKIESKEQWRIWAAKLPFFKFDSDWEVKVIPAFAGALIRFVIQKNDKIVSVYFDSESNVGLKYYENVNMKPYFETYADSVNRYSLNEIDKMMMDIRDYLK